MRVLVSVWMCVCARTEGIIKLHIHPNVIVHVCSRVHVSKKNCGAVTGRSRPVPKSRCLLLLCKLASDEGFFFLRSTKRVCGVRRKERSGGLWGKHRD